MTISSGSSLLKICKRRVQEGGLERGEEGGLEEAGCLTLTLCSSYLFSLSFVFVSEYLVSTSCFDFYKPIVCYSVKFTIEGSTVLFGP